MPILNYTTTISTEKTFIEINKALAIAGARSILCEYDVMGVLVAISFSLNYNGCHVMNFRLPSNVEGVLQNMKFDKKVPKKYHTEEQASRVAWRIVKDWVLAQLALVQASQADIKEVFMPYAVLPNGNTLFKQLQSNNYKLISGGTGE